MKADHLGLVLLVLGETGLGGWTLLRILDTDNLVDLLRLFSLC
jgi:hypothetical protein